MLQQASLRVTLGKLLGLFLPPFVHLYNGTDKYILQRLYVGSLS